MKLSVSIDFHGLPLDVHGDFVPARRATYDNPPESAEFEVTKVDLQGCPEADVASLLDAFSLWDTVADMACVEAAEQYATDKNFV